MAGPARRGVTRRTFLGTATAGTVAAIAARGKAPAIAQTKPTVLKWAHVYEVAEAYHNEALGLGTVDIIYTGAAFVGGVHKPLSISNAPYIYRNYEHWKAYRSSPLFRRLADEYGQKTGNRIVALTYYGERHLTSNKE